MRSFSVSRCLCGYFLAGASQITSSIDGHGGPGYPTRLVRGEEQDEIGHFLRIADIPEEPPVTREQVADKLAKRVPEDIRILIDIERHWARELELDTGRPNLLLLDKEGKLAAAFRGRMEPELLLEVRVALDELVGPR